MRSHRRPFETLAAAAAGLLLTLTLQAEPAFATSLGVSPPRLAAESMTLDNGLRVLLLEDHSVPVAAVEVWYHVGSKDERAGRSGFAHLFEHLMFKGSDHVGLEEHKSFIQSIGGRYNATTDFDRTLYYEIFPSHYLERILWMEADRMASLHVSEEAFRSERDVVKEERRVRVDNPPFGRLFEIVLDATYTRHPYRITPIGSMDDLDAATLEDVRGFYRTFYVPNNATLVVAGDFDPSQVKGWVQRHFGGIPKGPEIPRKYPQEPEQKEERRVVVHDANAPLPAVVLTFHTPGDGEADAYALDVASHILSRGESSRLYRRLVYEEQMALSAQGQIFLPEDPGVFFFFAVVKPGFTPEQAEAALLEEARRLAQEPVSAEELEKARNQLIAELVFGRQTVQQKADALGYAEVILGDWTLANRQLEEYQKVSAEDIQRVARTYLGDRGRTVVYMLPEAKRPKPPASEKEEGSTEAPAQGQEVRP